jgi:16S rRNA (uracil1498-N3)-methyltransferase
MRITRLFVGHDHSLNVGDDLELSEEQSHHLLRVLRLQKSDFVCLFDGSGGEWLASLAKTGKRTCTVLLQEKLPDVPRPLPLGLGLALLKGDAFDRALQKAVELGVQYLALLNTDRANVHWGEDREERRLTHIRKIVVSACEQSGTRFLPTLVGPLQLDELKSSHLEVSRLLIALHPGSPALPLTLPLVPTTLLVGPEGGWSERELSWFESQGIIRHGMGGQVMRAETAPIAALAAVRHGWGWDS